jgi:hypothetical protein
MPPYPSNLRVLWRRCAAKYRCQRLNAAMAHPPRPFPSPWRADPRPGGKVVRDANGKALAHIYSRENEDEGRQAKVLTGDEARRVAVNIARLPAPLGKADRD